MRIIGFLRTARPIETAQTVLIAGLSCGKISTRALWECLNWINLALERNYGNGEMRALWEEDRLRAQPELFNAGDKPGLPPEFAESYCFPEWETGTENPVREMHSHTG